MWAGFPGLVSCDSNPLGAFLDSVTMSSLYMMREHEIIHVSELEIKTKLQCRILAANISRRLTLFINGG